MRGVIVADPLLRKMYYVAHRRGLLEPFRAGDAGAVRDVAASLEFYWSLYQLPEYQPPEVDLAALFQ